VVVAVVVVPVAVMPVAMAVVMVMAMAVVVVMAMTVVVVMAMTVVMAVMTVHMAVVTVHAVTAAAVHHVPTAAAATTVATAVTAGFSGGGRERRHADGNRCDEGEDCSALEHFNGSLGSSAGIIPGPVPPVSLKRLSAAVSAITLLANATPADVEPGEDEDVQYVVDELRVALAG
jgi:hypothetical protein